MESLYATMKPAGVNVMTASVSMHIGATLQTFSTYAF